MEKIKTDDTEIKDMLQRVLKDAPDREGGTRWEEKQRKKWHVWTKREKKNIVYILRFTFAYGVFIVGERKIKIFKQQDWKHVFFSFIFRLCKTILISPKNINKI